MRRMIAQMQWTSENRLAWDDVRVFLALCRARTVGRAAALLGVDQSTVSRRLAAMEASLATTLFERGRDGVEPTKSAEDLLPVAEEIEGGMLRFANAADRLEREVEGVVRVTCPPDVAEVAVVPHLPALLAAYPKLRVELEPGEAVLDLARREADIALRMNRVPERGDLAVRRLARIGFSLYAAHGYLSRARKQPGYDPHRLEFVGLTYHPKLQSQGDWVERFARDGGIRLRLSEAFLRHQAIVDGQGVSLLPCYLGDGDARLARVIDPPAELEEDVYLLVHNDLKALPQIKAVANGLVRVFRAHARALAGRR